MEGLYRPHQSVLLQETISFILENMGHDSPLILDCTFGGGGHSFALLEKHPTVKILATDQDPDALKNGQDKISRSPFGERIQLLPMNFKDFPQWWREHYKDNKDKGEDQFLDGIIMDLGVSSHHFDNPERGFSFRQEAPLDMRMNSADCSMMTAADILMTSEESELADIFYLYGEERLSRRIAKRIVEQRRKENLQTTKQLADLIYDCYPPKLRRGRIHPATRCFQALRIAVNQELDVLQNTLDPLFQLLRPGSLGRRMAVISFHSLEDRIVKTEFKKIYKNEGDHSRIITKRPLIPSEEEIRNNPRSRSAKLRVIEKL